MVMIVIVVLIALSSHIKIIKYMNINKKYTHLSEKEMSEIHGGGKWIVIYRQYGDLSYIDANGLYHYSVRTTEEKFRNDGSAFNPPKIRDDK